jgi:ABC-type antimicrobial peptide transport system permease subunit
MGRVPIITSLLTIPNATARLTRHTDRRRASEQSQLTQATTSPITETVFALPGMGRLVVQAVENHDFPVVQAAVCFIGTIILVLNLLVDICYAWLDPRIRLG